LPENLGGVAFWHFFAKKKDVPCAITISRTTMVMRIYNETRKMTKVGEGMRM
jgi:hypothetical protein